MRSYKTSVVAVGVSLATALVMSGCERSDDTAGVDTTENATIIEKRSDTLKESVQEKTNEAEITVSDTVITTKVKTAILNDPDLKVFEIDVDTVGGVVTLTGVVDAPQIIDHAKTVVGSVEGVKSVKNKLQVKPTG